MWHPKGNHTSEHIYKIETDSDIQNELKVATGGKCGGQSGGQIIREVAQCVHAALFKINDQQGLTVKHRELCSTSCGSPDGRAVL